MSARASSTCIGIAACIWAMERIQSGTRDVLRNKGDWERELWYVLGRRRWDVNRIGLRGDTESTGCGDYDDGYNRWELLWNMYVGWESTH